MLLAAEADRETIAKQRHELQLLIEELKDRDRELNEMTATHRQQLAAWDDDRKRLVAIDNRNARLEYELHRRGEQLRALLRKLKSTECEAKTRRCAQEAMQSQLTKMAEEQSRASMHIQDFEEKNQSLSQSLKSLSLSLDDSKNREQELLAVVQLKEKDLSDSSRLVVELSAKLRSADQVGKQAEKSGQEAKRLADEWKDKYFEAKEELDRVSGELAKTQAGIEERSAECEKAKREAATLRSDLVHAAEREKRKDQLVELQKSKQERTDAELSSLRQIYERTRRDLEALYHSIESSRHGMFDGQANDDEGDPDSDSLSVTDLASSPPAPRQRRSPLKVALSPTLRSGCWARRSGDGTRSLDQEGVAPGDGDDKLSTSLEKLTTSLDALAELHESSLHSLNGGRADGGSSSSKRDGAQLHMSHVPQLPESKQSYGSSNQGVPA